MDGGFGQHHQLTASGIGDPRLLHREHAAHHDEEEHLPVHSPTLATPGKPEGFGPNSSATATGFDPKTMGLRFASIASPTVVSNVLWFSLFAVSQMFIGQRLGAEALAKVSVAVSVFNLMGLALGLGMCSALDTLVSQAFGRDPHSAEMGTLLQRGMAINVIMAVPISIAFHTTGPLLELIFGTELGRGAHEFLVVSPPMLILVLHLQAFFKSLQAINVPEMPLMINVIGAALNPLYNYWLAYSLQGAVYALTLSFVTMMIATALICRHHPRVVFRNAPWPAPGILDRALVREYLAIGIPSLASLCAEWWAFELLQVVAAQVSVHAVAVFSLVMSITIFAFSFPLGISVAASVTIGNSLGANHPWTARKFAVFALVADQCLTVFTCLTLFFFSRQIASAYTSDADILDDIESLAPLITLFHWSDSTQFTLQGIFRGAGRQSASAKAVLFSLWGVGVPAPYVFAIYMGMGVKGIVLGLLCGILVEIPLLGGYLLTWDWPAIALVAAKLETQEARVAYKLDMEMEERRAPVPVDEEELPIAV